MKPCSHTLWFGLSCHGNSADVVVSDRVRHILNQIPDRDVESPQLLVLIGNTAKAVALRELFGVKTRNHGANRGLGEVHLHLDPRSAFHGKPLLIADSDLSGSTRARFPPGDCHEFKPRVMQRSSHASDPGWIANGIYAQLLSPFSDVFCVFSDDIGGFRPVARHLAAWLEHGRVQTVPASTCPRVVIVTEKIPLGAESEEQARTDFLELLRDETTKDLSALAVTVEVIALFPGSSMSGDARHRRLKERLMNGSDRAQENRANAQLLFSFTHLAALLESAIEHFTSASREPFNLVRASRVYNPVALDLEQHISTLLTYVKTPAELTEFAAPTIASSLFLDSYPPGAHHFSPGEVFPALYQSVFHRVAKAKVIPFEQSRRVVLRSVFVAKVKRRFAEITRRSLRTSLPPARRRMKSDNTCFSCLRRRPQFELECGHVLCENCVKVLSHPCAEDPWLFRIRQCPLCRDVFPNEVTVRTHPPTASVGVLYIDGGGVRGVAPLEMIKRIHTRIGLPIPFQRFIKVAFGISSGGLIVADMFLNGYSIQQSTVRFEQLAKAVFRPREPFGLPFLPRIVKSFMRDLAHKFHPFPTLFRFVDLLISYLADGLYPRKPIEDVLKHAFGTERNILQCTYATLTGTRVGLPVATVGKKPSSRIFTNYNGVIEPKKDQGGDDNSSRIVDRVIRPKDGFGKILLWEIAASAAPGFFPPKQIHGLGTFQDAGPLENDPLLSALSAVADLFPWVEQPDFVVSLGTGEPKPGHEVPTTSSRNVWKNGAFPRLYRLFWEKMRDAKVREAFRAHPRYHRLDVQFDDDQEPRLDDLQSIPHIQAKARNDNSLSRIVDNVARCFLSSLFYFELDSVPERFARKYVATGHILCSIRHGDPAFPALFDRLSCASAQLRIDESFITRMGDRSYLSKDGNFRKRVEFKTDGNGSPFSIDKLITLQGFAAVFGRPDHRKRNMAEYAGRLQKRQRRA
ncbi:FabD/lysophospholipase-like protein [Xylariomycetidae sp. FL2044]|nr:FabD/lysophospholipase-like protein [Xylariomycetidae sp. FL2044]